MSGLVPRPDLQFNIMAPAFAQELAFLFVTGTAVAGLDLAE
jgi:hypothetical protein